MRRPRLLKTLVLAVPLALAVAGCSGGGAGPSKLRLVVLNNGSDPSTASAQARGLVQRDHAVALLGFATPQIVTPTALVAEQLRVPFLTSLMPVEAPGGSRWAASPRAPCQTATGAPARHRPDSSPPSRPRSERSTRAARTTPRRRSPTRWPRC